MKRGFTLVELVIVTAVLSIVIVMLSSYLTNQIIDNAVQNAQADLQLETRLTLDTINTDIKHSANVDETNRFEDTHNTEGWVSGANTLVLARPAEDSNDNILFEDPAGYVSYKNNLVYFVENGVLYKRTLAADIDNNASATTCPAATTGCPADSILAEGVSNFAINYYDALEQAVPPSNARSIGVTLEVTKSIFGRNVSVEYSIIRTVLRNE